MSKIQPARNVCINIATVDGDNQEHTEQEIKTDDVNAIADMNISNSLDKDQTIDRKKKKQIKKEAKQNAILRRQQRLSKRPSTTFFGKHKWLGGAIDPKTGKIYGIPSHSYQIICITPASSPSGKAAISTIPLPNEYQEGKYKWLRGLIYDDHLYGIPAWNTKGILKVSLKPEDEGKPSRVKVLPLPHEPNYYMTDPVPAKNDVQGEEDAEENTMNRKHHKFLNVDRGRWMWHGGNVGKNSEKDDSNAAIYCIPSNAKHVLKVHLDGSDKVEEIGQSLEEGQNKW